MVEASTENTAASISSMQRKRRELLNEYYNLRDRALKLQQFRIRYCAAGIGIMGERRPVRDWDREKELCDRIDAKTELLYQERERLISLVQEIEAGLAKLPYWQIEGSDDFD